MARLYPPGTRRRSRGRQFLRFYLLANNWKAKNILYIPAPCKHLDKETARNLMGSYVAGNLAPAEKRDFQTHCLACEERRSTQALILLLLRSPTAT
jgi:hypothetical protein